VVKAFRAVSQYPSPTSVRIMDAVTVGSGMTILSSWSQTSLERGKSIKFQQTHFVDSLLHKSSDMAPVDTSSEYVYIPFSNYRLVYSLYNCACCDICHNSHCTPGGCKQRPVFMLAVLAMSIWLL